MKPECRCGIREGDRGGKFYKRHWREGSKACRLSLAALRYGYRRTGWREKRGEGECCGGKTGDEPTYKFYNRHKSLGTPPCSAAVLLARRLGRAANKLPPEDPVAEERGAAIHRYRMGGEPETERERNIVKEVLARREKLVKKQREADALRAVRRMKTEAVVIAREGPPPHRLKKNWREYAACRSAPISLEFFPENPADIPLDAAALCAVCAVRGQCLAYALSDENFIGGVWGGVPAETIFELRGLPANPVPA